MEHSPNQIGLRARARTFALILAFGFLATGVIGCTSGPPEEAPGIVGEITNLTRSDQASGSGVSILVEASAPDPSFVSDKASVHVAKGTPVYDATGQKTGLDVLTEGAQVRVWFTGPVAESYPVQAEAKAVQFIASE